MTIVRLFQQSGWVWQTKAPDSSEWSVVSTAASRAVGRAPDLGRRCLVPWTATLTVSVSKRDVGRAYRCYVYYRLYGQYHNSSPATYVLRGYSL